MVTWLLPLLAACLFPGVAPALEVRGLYEARVGVTGQSDAERRAALVRAFEDVLVKVTGRRDVAADPAVAESLEQPMGFVQQYFYVPRPAPDSGDEPAYRENLQVHFDEAAVDGLVRRAGLPVWGRERPGTLVWVAVDEGQRRFLLAPDDDGALRETLLGEAARRGLPVLLPLLDLEDRGRLAFADVWGNFSSAILDASDRYRVSAVVTARLLQEPDGRWVGRWLLHHDGVETQWQLAGRDVGEAIRAGVDALADALAERYAHRPGDAQGPIELLVSDVPDLAAYRRLLAYLGRLDGVHDLTVEAVEDDRVRVRLQVSGDALSLGRSIGFGRTLVAATGALPDRRPTAPAVLHYRLLP